MESAVSKRVRLLPAANSGRELLAVLKPPVRLGGKFPNSQSDKSREGGDVTGVGSSSRDNDAESSCDDALRVWKDRFQNDPRWTFLPSVVSGESPIHIDQVFVELFAIAENRTEDDAVRGVEDSQRRSRQILATQYPVVSIPAMVARTLERCVVLGEPGSGKSTLIQWLARAVANSQCPDFDVAVLVKLSPPYAKALAKDSRPSLIQFFLDSRFRTPRIGGRQRIGLETCESDASVPSASGWLGRSAGK